LSGEGAGKEGRTDGGETEAATAAVSKAQQRVAEVERTLCEQRQKLKQVDGAKETQEKVWRLFLMVMTMK